MIPGPYYYEEQQRTPHLGAEGAKGGIHVEALLPLRNDEQIEKSEPTPKGQTERQGQVRPKSPNRKPQSVSP
jgi:hypothetical protein